MYVHKQPGQEACEQGMAFASASALQALQQTVPVQIYVTSAPGKLARVISRSPAMA